jgi:hypothetical protein
LLVLPTGEVKVFFPAVACCKYLLQAVAFRSMQAIILSM